MQKNQNKESHNAVEQIEEESSVFSVKQIEEEVLSYWAENKCFEKSVTGENESIIEENKESKTSNAQNIQDIRKQYTFYDGPPFANGLPHYGHILTGFAKDLFARYHTMLGERVERRFGWDCHGLPAEMESEKELGVGGQIQIKEYGIDKFNAHCKESVLKYTNEWRNYVTRQARWVDFDNDYKTMDLSYMESVIWAFKQLYNKGLLYEDTRVVPYSWKCQTPLSNFETHLDNSYRPKQSKSVYVKFELEEVPQVVLDTFSNTKKVFMVVWTTTPWTLPSNLALAVGEDIEYAMIEIENDVYIVAKDRVQELKLDFLEKIQN